jgi:hypothetical protein
VARKGSRNSGGKSFLDEKTQNITKINLKTKNYTKSLPVFPWQVAHDDGKRDHQCDSSLVQGGVRHRLLGGTTL